MFKGIDELKTLTKHVSCEWKCKFDGRNIDSIQKWNNNKYWCECKNWKVKCDEIINVVTILHHEGIKITPNFN